VSLQELFEQVRSTFPTISEAADRLHERHWGSDLKDSLSPYAWFESLANALNAEMSRGADPKLHLALFSHLERALDSSEEVFRCLDVAFVENLFWQIPSRKAAPYWQLLPSRFRTLYEEFHRHPPVQ